MVLIAVHSPIFPMHTPLCCYQSSCCSVFQTVNDWWPCYSVVAAKIINVLSQHHPLTRSGTSWKILRCSKPSADSTLGGPRSSLTWLLRLLQKYWLIDKCSWARWIRCFMSVVVEADFFACIKLAAATRPFGWCVQPMPIQTVLYCPSN